jgi:hypothetical protein
MRRAGHHVSQSVKRERSSGKRHRVLHEFVFGALHPIRSLGANRARQTSEDVLGAKEIGDVRRCRTPEDVFGIPLLYDPSLVEDYGYVAEQPRLAEVVGHLQDREAALVIDRAQHPARDIARPRIQCAERFVEEQHFGTARQGARDRDELPLTAAQGLDRTVTERRHSESRGDVLRRLGGRGAILDVLPHGKVREQVRMLIDDSEPSLLGRRVCQIVASERDAAGIDANDPGDRLEQRRLAGAGRTDHDAVRPLRNFERDVRERKSAGARVDVLE